MSRISSRHAGGLTSQALAAGERNVPSSQRIQGGLTRRAQGSLAGSVPSPLAPESKLELTRGRYRATLAQRAAGACPGSESCESPAISDSDSTT